MTTSASTITTDHKHQKALQFIEDVTTNADQVQKKVLSEILSCNAHVEYLQRHGLDGRTDRKTFKKVMPVITYEDLRPYITRIANGDTSPILCAQPISELFVRSKAKTPGGLVARSALTAHLKERPHNAHSVNTSPLETIFCEDPYQSMYSQLRCGLCLNTQVFRVGASLAYDFITAIRFLQQHWTLLCNDIRIGTLNA
ncbi:GH3 auxin-responsive promoter [Macleaya cordata]|uniref:GH3 auxin-responsive promoter n=1 Tax=Macleaya cordata TaxID=56857 RepID=A0A200QVF0_MACCD|nr:GH3 auxin-responsive promoter [Macleaya cordata]